MTTSNPLGYQQRATLSAAIGLTVPVGATIAIAVCESQDVRWRDDGTDPTATVGMLLEAKKPYVFTSKLEKIKFIETTASAKLNVSYY